MGELDGDGGELTGSDSIQAQKVLDLLLNSQKDDYDSYEYE